MQKIPVYQRTSPVDPDQERLTRIHIISNLPSILHDFEQLREAIDMAVSRFSLQHQGNPLNNLDLPSSKGPRVFYCATFQSKVDAFLNELPKERLAHYPIGECTSITMMAWRLFKDEGMLPQTEGFSHLRKFISSGGMLRVIWGGIRQVYFQTAFQAGNYYFDIANDTVDINKPKTACAFLKESGFHDILSYKEYMRIKSPYHHVELLANNCLPGIFPYFPLLACSKTHEYFSIDISMRMARLNITTNFRTVFDALDSKCLENRLDRNSLRQIKASLQKLTGSRKSMDLLKFRVMNKEEMHYVLHNSATVGLSEHMERLKASESVANFLNVLWNEAKMYKQIVHR